MKEKFVTKNNSYFDQCRIGKGKRFFDVVLSSLLVLLFSPAIIIISLAIKITSKGPILYKSQRVGTGYDVFTFYKFRTMYEGADKERGKLSELNEYLVSHKEKSNDFVNIEKCPYCKPGKPCSPLLFIDGIEICEDLYMQKKTIKTS